MGWQLAQQTGSCTRCRAAIMPSGYYSFGFEGEWLWLLPVGIELRTEVAASSEVTKKQLWIQLLDPADFN